MSRLRRVLDDSHLIHGMRPPRGRVENEQHGKGERDIAFGDLLDASDRHADPAPVAPRSAHEQPPHEDPLQPGADGGAGGMDGRPATAPSPRPAAASTLAEAPTPSQGRAPAAAPAAAPAVAPASAPASATTTSTAGPPSGWQPLVPGRPLASNTAVASESPVAQPTPSPTGAGPATAPLTETRPAAVPPPVKGAATPRGSGVRAWLQQRQILPDAPPPEPAIEAPVAIHSRSDLVAATASLAAMAGGEPGAGPIRWADLVRTGGQRAVPTAATPQAVAPTPDGGAATSDDMQHDPGRSPDPSVRIDTWDASSGPADEPIILVDRVAPGTPGGGPAANAASRPTAPPPAPQGGPPPDAFAGASAKGTSSGMRLRVPTGDGETLRGDVRLDTQARGVRLALAAENAHTARSLSTAHEMLRAQLADEGYQLDSYVVRHDGRSVVRMDSGAGGGQTHADGRGRESSRHGDDERPDQRPRTDARDMSDDPVVAGWFV